MANNRTFQAQALVVNGIAVGGLGTISLAASYSNTIVSTPDGAVGAEDVDRAGLTVAISIDVSDVTKAADILAAAATSTTFVAQESGTATWHNYTIPGTVITGMNLNVSDSGDGRLQLTGLVRFADGVTDLDGVIQLAAAQGPPTNTFPTRLYRPHDSSYDPGVAILPLHTKSLTLALDANVASDFGDSDIGTTAVDIIGWNPLRVTLEHGDAKAAAPSHVVAKMMAAGRGILAVQLKGRGGVVDKVLTINNLLWTGATQNDRSEYSSFTMDGSCGWRNAATVYSLNATNPLFVFA